MKQHNRSEEDVHTLVGPLAGLTIEVEDMAEVNRMENPDDDGAAFMTRAEIEAEELRAEGRVKGGHARPQGGFVLHGFLNPPNEITAGLDILPAL